MEGRKRKVTAIVGGTTRLHRELLLAKKSEECGSRFQIEFKGDDASRLRLVMPSASFCDPTNDDAMRIFKGLERNGEKFQRSPEIVMELVMDNYPEQPPFVFVVKPRFAFHTGHVTIGGSICTELLTTQGWNPKMTLETLILSLHLNFIEGRGIVVNDRDVHHDDPRAEYTEQEARNAYRRAVQTHTASGEWK